MLNKTRAVATLSAVLVLAATPAAFAQGGTGGGGTSGGGGGCTPLTTTASVVRTDFSPNWHIGVQATIRNCTSANQLYHVNVSVPNSGETPFDADTGLAPGAAVTRAVSPSGGTPLQLQFGQNYTVVTTLTQTTGSASSVIAATTATVTIPAS